MPATIFQASNGVTLAGQASTDRLGFADIANLDPAKGAVQFVPQPTLDPVAFPTGNRGRMSGAIAVSFPNKLLFMASPTIASYARISFSTDGGTTFPETYTFLLNGGETYYILVSAVDVGTTHFRAGGAPIVQPLDGIWPVVHLPNFFYQLQP